MSVAQFRDISRKINVMSPEAAVVARLLLVALLPAAAAATSQVMGQQQQLLPGEILGEYCFVFNAVKNQ